MSSGLRLTQTSRKGLEPVNSRLLGQYELLRSLLLRDCGKEHALLLSEPVPVLDGSETVWFAAEGDAALRLSSLPEAEAAAVRARLARLVSDIEALAIAKSEEKGGDPSIARLLRDCMVIPDADRVFVVDGHPVLVDWGFRIAQAGSVPRNVLDLIGISQLARTSPAPSPAEPTPARSATTGEPGDKAAPLVQPAAAVVSTVPVRRASWTAALLWSLFALLLMFLGQNLLQSCALGASWLPQGLRSMLPDRCPEGVAAGPSPELTALDVDVRRLDRAVADKAASCTVSCPAPVVPPPQPQPRAEAPAQPSVTDIEKRLDENKAERGAGPEISAAWNTIADLDLALVCPDGTRVYFGNTSGCGARLVVDKNAASAGATASAIEHVIFDAEPARGAYHIDVTYYGRNGAAEGGIPFTVVLRWPGKPPREFRGTVSSVGETVRIASFESPDRG